MATAEALIGLGMPAELALRIGEQQVSVTTTGAVQGAGGGNLNGPGNKIVLATFASASDAITLPDEAEVGDEITIVNISANAGVIYPHVGGAFNGNSANGTIAMAAAGSATCELWCKKVSANRWMATTSTDIG